jgi:outer membrane protein assembly factor BamE (lipoprotein component of BamABCDE complex)
LKAHSGRPGVAGGGGLRASWLWPLLALALAGCGERPAEQAEPRTPPEGTIDVSQEAQRVQLGMSEADVVAILGEPRVRVGEDGGERLTFWTFDAQRQVRSRVYVTFDGDGKVVNVETIPL